MSKLVENVDYQLVPLDQAEDAWGVRFLTGHFVESVISYGAVSFNEVADHMTFNFKLLSSPDDSLSENDEELQEYCADVLTAIIANGVEDGSVILHEREKE